MLSGLFYLYFLDRYISDWRGVWLDFIITLLWDISVFHVNSVDPDQTPLSLESDQGLHSLPMVLLWEARLMGNEDLKKKCLLFMLLLLKQGLMTKAPYSTKIDIFIQERFNKLIYGINIIIKYGIWQPVKFQFVSRFWSGSKVKWFVIVSLN